MTWTSERVLTVVIATFLVGVIAGIGATIYRDNLHSACSGDVSCENSPHVLVANRDIPPNTELDPLIDAGDNFRIITVPNDAVVADAIQTVDQLRGETTSAYILQNEQIPVARLQGIP